MSASFFTKHFLLLRMEDPIRQVDRWSYFHFTSGEIGSRRRCDFPKVTPLLSGGLGTGGRGLLSITGGRSELREGPPPHPRPQGPPSPPRPAPRPPCAAPTEGARVAWRRLAWPPGVVVAHPLLAAAPGHAHPPGVAAPDARGARAEAERRAAHRAAHACAVVLAVGLEGLAVVVAHAVQHAAHADHLCGHRRRGSGRWAPAAPRRAAPPPLDHTPPCSRRRGGAKAGQCEATGPSPRGGSSVGPEQRESQFI